MDNNTIIRHGFVFLDRVHVDSFEKITPGKLREDLEWASTVYLLTMDSELRSKIVCHLDPYNRKIRWDDILAIDFGSGHRTVILWAFWLWSGHSWGGWEGKDGIVVPQVDTVSRWYSMGSKLRFGALVAQAYRWGYQTNFCLSS